MASSKMGEWRVQKRDLRVSRSKKRSASVNFECASGEWQVLKVVTFEFQVQKSECRVQKGEWRVSSSKRRVTNSKMRV